MKLATKPLFHLEPLFHLFKFSFVVSQLLSYMYTGDSVNQPDSTDRREGKTLFNSSDIKLAALPVDAHVHVHVHVICWITR